MTFMVIIILPSITLEFYVEAQNHA